MPDRSDLAARVADLERQLEDLRNQRTDALAEGAMLKALLDDIAKRREVERRLTQAQEWLHLSQEAGWVAAYTFDMTSGRLEWSASTMALYGFDPAQEPSIEQWLGAIHSEDRDSARAVAEAALAGDAEVKHRF